MRKLSWYLLVVIVLYCCAEKQEACIDAPVIAEENKVSIAITRLEKELLACKTKEQIRGFINRYPSIAKSALRTGAYPSDSVLLEVLVNRFNNPHMDSLRMEVERVFPSLETLEADFSRAFSYLKLYYPNFKIPKIYTVTTGFDTDLIISDSTIVIGLDYYLGEGAKFRPLNTPQYIQKRYAKEYIVSSCMLLYASSPAINATDLKDKTLLADMVFYGKSYYMAKQLMPCLADSVLMEFTAKELQGSIANQDIVWAHFLDNELLYETNNFIKQKYIGERPKTFDIGEDCPGRIGRWLGWEIVEQYMDKEDIPIQELMRTKNAQVIFESSNYRPIKN